VSFDRLSGEPELLGDLGVGESLGQECEDLELFPGQAAVCAGLSAGPFGPGRGLVDAAGGEFAQHGRELGDRECLDDVGAGTQPQRPLNCLAAVVP
jgi:hypothetical protein